MNHTNKANNFRILIYNSHTDLSEIDLCKYKQYKHWPLDLLTNTGLDNYIDHTKHTDCHNKLDANNASSGLLHPWAPMAPHQGPLLGRNPWTKQLVLSWSRVPQARLRDTWAHLGSHICINAYDSISFQSNGPQPWYGHLVGIWTSEHQDKDIKMSDGPPMQPLPSDVQNTQIWKNFKWILII